MCGHCGPMGDDPVQRVFVQPEPPPPVKKKEVVLDPRYLNIVVPDNVNWNQKADLAGLKAVELGQEHLSLELSPKQYFKVISEGNVLWYQKTPVLNVAKKILHGMELPNDDNRIEELCGAIISVSDNVMKYNTKNRPSIEKSTSTAASDAQVKREPFERNIETYQNKGSPRFVVPLTSEQSESIDSKLTAIQQHKNMLATISNPRERINALKLYRAQLADYLKYVADLVHATTIEKHPELNNINNIIKAVDEETRAYKEANIAGRLAQIEAIDKQIPQLINETEEAFAKAGNIIGMPGVTLYEADQLLKQRRALVTELKEWISSPEEHSKEQALRKQEEEEKRKDSGKFVRWEASLSQGGHTFVVMQEAPIVKKLNEAIAKLAGGFSNEQMKILAELKNGQVRKKNSHLGGLVKTNRTDTEVANEIRPILTTLMARAMLLNLPQAKTDVDTIEKQASKFRDVWLEISRPNGNFNSKLQNFFEGWNKLKTG